MKSKYILEYNKWVDDLISSINNISVNDDFYTMEFIDIDYDDENHFTLFVKIFENNDTSSTGNGSFYFEKNDNIFNDFSITSKTMDGLLEELFFEDPEIIFDFLNKLIKSI